VHVVRGRLDGIAEANVDLHCDTRIAERRPQTHAQALVLRVVADRSAASVSEWKTRPSSGAPAAQTLRKAAITAAASRLPYPVKSRSRVGRYTDPPQSAYNMAP